MVEQSQDVYYLQSDSLQIQLISAELLKLHIDQKQSEQFDLLQVDITNLDEEQCQKIIPFIIEGVINKNDFMSQHLIQLFMREKNCDLVKPQDSFKYIKACFRSWQISEHMGRIKKEFNIPLGVLLSGKIPTNLRKKQQEVLQDYLRFYNKNFINNSDEFKTGKLGHNLRLIPQKKQVQQLYDKTFNSFHQIFDLEFCKTFETFFQCQACQGANESPNLFYLISILQNKQPFCDCIMCDFCAQESVKNQECQLCFRNTWYIRKNQDDSEEQRHISENTQYINSAPIKYYYKLDFRDPERILEEINQKILSDGQIPIQMQNKLAKYVGKCQQYQETKQNASLFFAYNIKESFDDQQFKDLLDIITNYYSTQKMFKFLDKKWDNFESVQELEKQVYEFKDFLYNQFFQKLMQNRLVTSEEMFEMTNIVTPNNDREMVEKYKDTDLNKSNTLIKTLLEKFQDLRNKKLQKNASFSVYGIENLYNNFID